MESVSLGMCSANLPVYCTEAIRGALEISVLFYFQGECQNPQLYLIIALPLAFFMDFEEDDFVISPILRFASCLSIV